MVGSLQTETTTVRQGLVFEGLIKARWFCDATGISASATDELNGPTTPITVPSDASAVMFAAPCAGSCPFLRTVESSLLMYLSVQPPMSLDAIAWFTASSAASCGKGPSVASPPVSGRSVATVIVPWHAAIPVAPAEELVVVDEVPQAASTPNAAIDPIDKTPLVGLTMCWVLLSLRGFAGEGVCVHSGTTGCQSPIGTSLWEITVGRGRIQGPSQPR